MEKFGLLVNNNKYATYKDSEDFLYPANKIDEYLIREATVPANKEVKIAFSKLGNPLRLDEFFFYCPQGAATKSIKVTLKNSEGKRLLEASFPTNVIMSPMPKFTLKEGDMITILSQVDVESVRFQFQEVSLIVIPENG
jgi:hypothetical protein